MYGLESVDGRLCAVGKKERGYGMMVWGRRKMLRTSPEVGVGAVPWYSGWVREGWGGSKIWN